MTHLLTLKGSSGSCRESQTQASIGGSLMDELPCRQEASGQIRTTSSVIDTSHMPLEEDTCLGELWLTSLQLILISYNSSTVRTQVLAPGLRALQPRDGTTQDSTRSGNHAVALTSSSHSQTDPRGLENQVEKAC